MERLGMCLRCREHCKTKQKRTQKHAKKIRTKFPQIHPKQEQHKTSKEETCTYSYIRSHSHTHAWNAREKASKG